MRRAIQPLWILGCLLLGTAEVAAAPDTQPAIIGPECVILLHGLGRTSRSLNKMEDALQAAGFRPVNLDYPSRKKTIQELAPETIERGLGRCTQMQAGTVHFVTHSMGGMLVRYYLSRHMTSRKEACTSHQHPHAQCRPWPVAVHRTGPQASVRRSFSRDAGKAAAMSYGRLPSFVEGASAVPENASADRQGKLSGSPGRILSSAGGVG